MKAVMITILVVMAGFLMLPGGLNAKEMSGKEAAVMDMFEEFYELESEFREEKWEEAEQVVAKIEQEYLNLVGTLKGTVDAKLLQKFSFLMGSFKKRLAKRNAEDMEDPYMELQGLFVDMMEQMDYPNPPVLIIYGLYVDEALEFMEKNNFHQVAEEMEEIEFFEDRAIAEAKGANMNDRKLKQFIELAEETNELAEKKKGRETIEKNLKEMKSLISSYLK